MFIIDNFHQEYGKHLHNIISNFVNKVIGIRTHLKINEMNCNAVMLFTLKKHCFGHNSNLIKLNTNVHEY